ncbi:hypothetical protein QBC44DRAFT_288339 [Cladorrhinum sp. PSN332]|nr:hypothetical protein QBC44DRAFT_288339 [Cladorrhinum sp. PSN332]
MTSTVQNSPALGRSVGKLSVDANGLTRYHYGIQAPPGIGSGNEPTVGLIYTHGTSNGIVGKAWRISGLSSIRLAHPSMPFDGVNNPPEYDRNSLCLSLDGSELLNIENAAYHSPDAKYATEVDETGKIVVPSEDGGGFLVTDAAGSQSYYGTSEDSRVLGSDGVTVREWRLKKRADPHGNYVLYQYVPSPAASSSSPPAEWKDTNTSYLESVTYTSNDKTGYVGRRAVLFEYSARSDPVVGTELGERVVQAHLLTAIRIAVRSGSSMEVSRSYELIYNISPVSGSSCLKSIQECVNGPRPSRLTPTEFDYTGNNIDPEKLFVTDAAFPATLKQTTNNLALLPLNISGRSLTDLACVRYNQATQQLTLKTFLAKPTPSERQDRVRLSWESSSTKASYEVNLPPVEITRDKPMPSFLGADLNGDGRVDLIMPFNDKGHLSFSISQSNGQGFMPYRLKPTSYIWSDDSSFMATDLSGNGFTDVVQIFPFQKKLSFRIFSGVNRNGEATLKDAVLLETKHDYSRTIDWLEVAAQRDSSKSLVRIYSEPTEKGFVKLLATTFALGRDQKSQGHLKETKSSMLGVYDLMATKKLTVLSCDINGDGVQDIVTCFADIVSKGPDVEITFTLTTFLNNGLGGFDKLGDSVKQSYRVPSSQGPFKPGSFLVTNIYGADYPSLAYVFRESASRDYVAVVFQGSSTGLIGKHRFARLAKAKALPPGDDVTLVASDLNGTNLGDWLAYSLHNDTFSVSPVYNTATTTDFLASARDSMGLTTEVEYVPMSNPAYYQPSVAWDKYTPDGVQDEYPLISASSYVVSRLNMRNDPTVNALPYANSISKLYAGARVSIRGRGWQGFANVRTYDSSADTTTSESFFQQWPLAGLQKLTSIESGRFPENGAVQSHKTEYEPVWKKKGAWTIFKIHKTSDQVDFITAEGKAARSYGTRYAYDAEGNAVEEEAWSSSGMACWTRYAYRMLDERIPLPVSKKITANQENRDFNAFEQGDLSLTVADFDEHTGVMKQLSEWSSSNRDFARTSYAFDEYGNEVETVNALGLRTRTTWDDTFHTYPVAVSESGPGVSIVSQAAFDAKSGVQVAKLEATGALTCFAVDDFGRITSVKKAGVGDGTTHPSGTEFFSVSESTVASQELLQKLTDTQLSPHQDLVLSFCTGPSGQYLQAHASSVHTATEDGRVGHWDFYDCVGKVRKTAKRHGKFDLSWTYSEYDSRGCETIKSFASKLADVKDIQSGLDWAPEKSTCLVSTFDALKRGTSQTRPGHGDDQTSIVLRVSYLDGGARVKRDVVELSRGDGTETVLSTSEKQFDLIREQEKLVASTDEAGSKTTYNWDALGRLICITDPRGKTETRSYDSLGNIVKTTDPYRNEITRKYDLGGNVVQTVNALGETVTQKYDCKNRVTHIQASGSGSGGSAKVYEYDTSNRDLLTSITVHGAGKAEAPESRYEFDYDGQGRLASKQVSIPGHEPFKIGFSYDWQGQVVKKILPDGSVLDRTYSGGLLSSATLQGAGFQTHVAYESYNGFEKPERWTVSPAGTSSAVQLSSLHSYDSQGFPLSHTLSASSALVDSRYTFNGLDQLTVAHEKVSGDSKRYTYRSGRLASEQVNDAAQASYVFDPSGNMTQNKDTELVYSLGKIVAKASNGESAEVEYDGAGRMVRRSASGESLAFTYDGFGQMVSFKKDSSSSDNSTQITYDYQGHVLSKSLPDASKLLHISDDYEVLLKADGSKRIKRKVFGADRVLVTIWTDIPTGETKPSNSVKLFHSDTKGNITHVFNADGTLSQRFAYDAFGNFTLGSDDKDKGNEGTTYEGRPLDLQSGLLDFRARWYDPLFGRFVTPDTILDDDSLKLVDGMNRYAFESNDPVNHIDPSGHWSSNFWKGALAAVGLAAVGLLLTVATGGGFLIAVATGALYGAATAGLLYSWSHREETDSSKFWGGWISRAAVGAISGAITGGFGSWMTSASGISSLVQWSERFARAHIPSYLAQRVIATSLHYGGRALASALTSTVAQITTNISERIIYDRKDINWYDGVGAAFGTGFVTGLLMAGASDYWAAKGKPRAEAIWGEVKKNPGSLIGKGHVNQTGANAGLEMGDFSKLRAAVQNTQPTQVMHIPYGNPFKG